jgi:putative ABC transport system permease protein
MLRLLRQISLRQLRASWGRTSLVIGGIAAGVSLIVAINIINTSVLENFRNTLELIAGPAQLEVTLGVGEVGFDESTLDIVRVDADVEAAVPLVRGTISLADDPGETLQLFGADLMAEEDLQRYPITTAHRQEVLRGLVDSKSILLTSAFAARHGIGLRQPVRLSTPKGVGAFSVRGLLKTEGVASAFGGQLAVMDLPAAQLALEKEGRIDQIDVVLRSGVDVETVRQRLETALPKSLTVARPAQRGDLYERILSSFQTMLTALSLLCLVAGIYIVYNTTSTGALHRALAMAGLRIIGADGAQLFRLLMLEALVLGATGTLLGIAIGIALAGLLTGMVSDSMGIIFQLRFPVETLAIEVWHPPVVAVLGTTAALFASYFAARRVATLDPLEVMRADLGRVVGRTPSRRLVLWWLALVIISAGALALEVRLKSIAWGNFGSTLWFASSIVIAIPLVTASAALLSRTLSRLSPAAGRVAAESLFRSPTRTGVTVAAVTLVLTLAITLACVLESLRKSASSYYQEGGFLVGDLVVSAVATEGGWLETPLPETMVTEIRGLAGVRSVEVARALPGQMYEGERIMLLGLSSGLLDSSHYGPRWYHDGDPLRAAAALQAGEGVNVSIAFADRFGLRVGDRITLDTPSDLVELPIVGIVYDYMSDRGTVTINRRLLVDRWGETTVHRLSVFLEAGTLPERVRQQIAEHVGAHRRLKIMLPGEMVDYHVALINRAFAFTDAIQLLVMVVTVAGIFDLLLAAIWERRRELALWRVIGAGEPTVRQSVLIESATIGGLGAILGTAVGLITAWIWIRVNFRYLLGFYLDYHFAFDANARYVVLVMGMTILAGYTAARYATRQPVLEGIQIE